MGQRNEKWPAIGIDLGTSYCCVGVWKNGYVEIIANDQGKKTTPSWVSFTDETIFFGEAAENHGQTNPTNTIFDAKRLIGRTFYDDSVLRDKKYWPFKVIGSPDFGEDKKPLVVITCKGEEKQLSAEEISAMILIKMKHIAEEYLGTSVKNAVVTVPAYFNDCQRQATKDAGTIAGLNVLRILNEPTAAAIAYDFLKKTSDNAASEKNVLIFDLGGGTFDVSLVSIDNDKFEVKAVGGDAHLGGGDFDKKMVDHFVEEFKKKHNKDVRKNRRALGRLRVACEKAKRTLSTTSVTTIELYSLFEDIDFCPTISRDLFDDLNIDLFSKCINIVRECLSDASIRTSDVDDIILIGGSTRIPKVQELLRSLFAGKVLSTNINPDEAVAYGAAVHAGILCGINKDKEMLLADVIPFSLGVEVASGNMSVVIPRNTTIPTRQVREYGVGHVKKPTYGDKDASSSEFVLEIHVYEGEGGKTTDNNCLGVFELCGEFPSNESTSSIEVCFEIDINGILNVSAQDKSSGNQSGVKIINRSRLTNTDLERLRNEAEEYMAQDKNYQQMVMAKNTLESYTNDMWERFKNGSLRVEDQELKQITYTIQNIRNWIYRNTDNVLPETEYEAKLQELKLICTPFISMIR